jgi:translation initiation factor 2 alpha subunit (eIF-2alpha)
MNKSKLSIVVLACCLTIASGCREQDLTEESFNEAMETAAQELERVAGDAADALEDVAKDAGEVVGDAYTEAEKAVDDAMKENRSEAE